MKKIKTYFNLFFILFMSIFTSSMCFIVGEETNTIEPKIRFDKQTLIPERLLNFYPRKHEILLFGKFLKKEGIWFEFIKNAEQYHGSNFMNILINNTDPLNWVQMAFHWGETIHPTSLSVNVLYSIKKTAYWSTISRKWQDYLINYNKRQTKVKRFEKVVYNEHEGFNRVQHAINHNYHVVSILNPTHKEISLLTPGDKAYIKSWNKEIKINMTNINSFRRILTNYFTESHDKIDTEITYLTKRSNIDIEDLDFEEVK